MSNSRNNSKQREQEEMAMERGLRTARRSAMYVVRTLLFLIMGCILCIMAFLTAMRISNLYILTSEGMALRADCIVADGAKNDLEEYFTLTFLDSDQALSDNTYDSYTITDYNYDLEIEKISVMPWSVVATVTATERLTLKGTINTDYLSEGQNASDFPLPPWMPVKYRIHFLNNDGRWYMNELEVVEQNPPENVLGTPDPNQSPIPAATPTPVPTVSPDAVIGTNP